LSQFAGAATRAFSLKRRPDRFSRGNRADRAKISTISLTVENFRIHCPPRDCSGKCCPVRSRIDISALQELIINAIRYQTRCLPPFLDSIRTWPTRNSRVALLDEKRITRWSADQRSRQQPRIKRDVRTLRAIGRCY